MNSIYTKSVLYAYPHIDELCEQIDELSEKQALASMTDTSPAFFQCQKLVMLIFEKQTFIELKEKTKRALKGLSQDELDCLDYKYFKQKPKDYFLNFDTKSRTYFRKQNRLLSKVSDRLERVGVTDEWFNENCMPTDFFRDMVETVIESQEFTKKTTNKEVCYS